jgi:hypothetical protein
MNLKFLTFSLGLLATLGALATPVEELENGAKMLKEFTSEMENKMKVSEAGFKEALKKFKAASAEKEKFLIASQILIQDSFRESTSHKAPQFTLSEAETQALSSVKSYMKQLQILSESFDKSVAQKVPACTRQEYLELRRSEGIDNLKDRTMPVLGLAMVYETQQKPALIEKKRRLIGQNKATYQKYHRLLDTYYADFNLAPNDDDDLKLRETRYSNELAALGVALKDVPTYVKGLIRIAPGCLGRVNFKMLNFVRTDVTLAKGKYILHQLRNQIAQGKPIPSSVYDVDLPKDGSDFGKPVDGWSNTYKLSREGNEFILSSAGPDSEEGTKDDIVVGRVSLNR